MGPRLLAGELEMDSRNANIGVTKHLYLEVDEASVTLNSLPYQVRVARGAWHWRLPGKWPG